MSRAARKPRRKKTPLLVSGHESTNMRALHVGQRFNLKRLQTNHQKTNLHSAHSFVRPPQRVLVFADYGADSRTVCAALRAVFIQAAAPLVVQTITSAQMRENPELMDPKNTLGFIMPGASDADYDRKLGPDNIAALRRFVAGGGRYMGICAGAYYACREVEWYAWDAERTKRKTPRIDFFDYRAHGPIRELIATNDIKTNQDRSLSHCAVADINWHDGKQTRRTEAMYWGGPHFDGDLSNDPKVKIIAHFNNVAGNPPAIIQREIGKGRAIISSIHPEIRGRDFAQAVYGSTILHERGKMIGERLEHSEHGRAALWHNLLYRLFPEYVR